MAKCKALTGSAVKGLIRIYSTVFSTIAVDNTAIGVYGSDGLDKLGVRMCKSASGFSCDLYSVIETDVVGLV